MKALLQRRPELDSQPRVPLRVSQNVSESPRSGHDRLREARGAT